VKNRICLLLCYVPVFLLLLAGPAAAVEGSWTSLGPEGGSAGSLAVSPDGTLWAGTSRGSGLFRSTDGGASWRRTGGALDHLSVLAVAVDPNRPEIVYASTMGEGIFRSTDGGATWAPSNQGLSSASGASPVVIDLVVDPRAPRRVIAQTYTGLYLSRDRGASWEKWSVPVHSVVVAPSDSRYLYGIGQYSAFRSTDGGLTWEPIEVSGEFSILAVHPTSPETVWAAKNSRYSRPELWRSDDGGRHWEVIWIHRNIHTLVVDPGEPDSLWAGVEGGILHIFDRGARRRFFPVSAGDDVVSLAFDPTDRRVLYAGTGWNLRSSTDDPGRRGGVWRSEDRGRTWRQRVHGMIATEVQAVIAPAPGRIVAAVLGRGPMIGDGSAARWLRGDRGIERDLHDLLADPADPDRLWASAWNGVFRSEDGGRSWTWSGEGLAGDPWFPHWSTIASLALDPSMPGGLWAAGWHGFFHSANGGRTWARVTSLAEVAFEAVAVDPNDPRKVWVTSQGGGGSFPTVFRSVDGGATWQETQFAAYLLDGLAVSSAGTVFVSTFGPLYRSTDGGITWQETSARGVVSVVPDPVHPGTIWAGGISGLYRSRDDGQTWEAVTTGPGTSVIRDLAVDSSGGLLVATMGHGLLRFQGD
jgi:photosystem II stability/assembly factor-like uncharacterized protein